MTIEKSPPPAREAKAPVSESKSTKPKSGASEDTAPEGSKDAGGFMAILVALDGAAQTVTSTVTSALPDVGTDAVATDTSATAVFTPLDNAALLAQSQQWAAKAGSAEVGADAKALPPRTPAAPVTLPVASTAADTPSPTVNKPVKLSTDTSSAKLDFAAMLNAAAPKEAPVESKTVLLAQKLEDQRMAPMAQAAAATAATVAAVSPVREELVREHAPQKGQAGEAIYTPLAVSSPGVAPGAAAPGAVAPVAEVYVAEQVKYWMSGDVQSAEMTLDGIATTPVEVSISMQGNEAHVAFRTDEAQARTALENASTQLKDMLMQEGLVLSGMSVGTSGAGGSGAQDRQGRQGARQGSVPVAQQAATAAIGPLPPKNSGRALDLFV